MTNITPYQSGSGEGSGWVTAPGYSTDGNLARPISWIYVKRDEVWPKSPGPGDYFEQIFSEYLATGRVLRGPVGECEAELIDLQDYIPFAVGWLQRAFG